MTKTNANMNKGNDFLKKKWCCFGGGGDRGYCSTIKTFYGCKFILIYLSLVDKTTLQYKHESFNAHLKKNFFWFNESHLTLVHHPLLSSLMTYASLDFLWYQMVLALSSLGEGLQEGNCLCCDGVVCTCLGEGRGIPQSLLEV